MGKAIWRGAVLGAGTGVVVSFVWSYRRDDTVDMALGRAVRMGAALGAAGAALGFVIDRRSRPSAAASRWSAGFPPARALGPPFEALGRAAEVARPRVEHAAEVARPRVEHAVEVARPRVEHAVEIARPLVEHALLEAARMVAVR